jgi:hypothetical protein
MKGRHHMKMTMDISKDGITGGRAAGFGWRKLRMIALPVLCVTLTAFLLGGCADGTYSGAYYAPDYASYYSDYGYAGDPYYGYDPGYYGGYVIGGSHFHRHFGHHHFGNDFRTSRGPSMRSAPHAPHISAPHGPSRR